MRAKGQQRKYPSTPLHFDIELYSSSCHLHKKKKKRIHFEPFTTAENITERPGLVWFQFLFVLLFQLQCQCYSILIIAQLTVQCPHQTVIKYYEFVRIQCLERIVLSVQVFFNGHCIRISTHTYMSMIFSSCS